MLLYVRDENLLYINNGQQIDCHSWHSHGLPSDRRWSISADLVQSRFTQIGPRSVSELESVLTLTTMFPWKGHGYVMWPIINFGGPIHISGTAETRVVKFCTKGYYIKSRQRDDKSPLKGVWFCSRDPFLCAQLWTLKKILTSLH